MKEGRGEKYPIVSNGIFFDYKTHMFNITMVT